MHCLLLLLLTAPVLTSAGGLGAILSKPLYQQLFPQALPVYQYDNLLEMAATYPAFANTGNDAVDKREVAAYVEEINKGDYCQPSAEYPCAPGKQYYGRGAIQLSWNYNYKDFGKAIGVDLVAQPDLVASRPDLVWRSALWYWNTDKWNGNIHDVVGQPGGFAYTTYLINGGLECGVNPPNRDSEKMRIANFVKFCKLLGVAPGDNLSCQTSDYPPKTPWPTKAPTSPPTPVVTTPLPTLTPTSPRPPTTTTPHPATSTPAPTLPKPTSVPTSAPPPSLCASPTGPCTNCNYNDGTVVACFVGWTQAICLGAGSNYHWCGA
uniref:Secreted protein n=1 Tax=Achlya hypogyna TaxID=1202772 RepID=A0A0A7CNV7_ACHHY|nr:secreted protein [Achlya hypogyna]